MLIVENVGLTFGKRVLFENVNLKFENDNGNNIELILKNELENINLNK